eukprot:3056200-Amphidinium_carterae.1
MSNHALAVKKKKTHRWKGSGDGTSQVSHRVSRFSALTALRRWFAVSFPEAHCFRFLMSCCESYKRRPALGACPVYIPDQQLPMPVTIRISSGCRPEAERARTCTRSRWGSQKPLKR